MERLLGGFVRVLDRRSSNLEGKFLLLDGDFDGGTFLDVGEEVSNDGLLGSLVGNLGDEGVLGSTDDLDVVLQVHLLNEVLSFLEKLFDFLDSLRLIGFVLDDLLSRLLGVLEDLLDLLGELILSVGKLLDLDFVVVLLNGIEADVNLVDNRLDLLLG